MLLNLEDLALAFEHYADVDIERSVAIRQRSIVGILNIATCPLVVERYIDILIHELLVQILQAEEAT